MNLQNSRSDLIDRRGELLAELFFQDLDPAFLTRPTTPDVGADLLVGFPNKRSGVNTFAVQVKSTERNPGARFPLQRSKFNRIAHSNLPGLLLVADVKRSRLYYAWLRSDDAESRTATVSIPLIEINETTRADLKRQFQSAPGFVGVAG